MSKTFTAKVFRWLHQVNADPELPASAAKVAIRLSPDFNEGWGGKAWSAFKTMGDDISLSERHVIRAIRALEARGHLRVQWGKQGRGHSSQYWMLEREPDLFDDEKPAPAPVFEQNKTGISGTVKPASGVRKPASGVVKPAPAPETLSRPTDQPSRGTHRVPKTQPPRVRPKKKKEAGGEDEDEAFARFWALYPRHDARERARKAFAAAVKAGVDPEMIIGRARVYAITERQRIERGEDPKYTMYAVNWLRDRPWENPLPPGIVLDQAGNVVAVEQPPPKRAGGQKTWAEVADELLAEVGNAIIR
jgi:hypothetical protein